MKNSHIIPMKCIFTRVEASDLLNKLVIKLKWHEILFERDFKSKINHCYVKNNNNNNSVEELESYVNKVIKLYPMIHYHFHYVSLLVGHELKSIIFENSFSINSFF